MRALLILTLAAVLEVGGDALVRWGLKGGRVLGFVLGAGALTLYGVVVNTPDWNFGRLLGVYIVVFFIVAQLIALIFFHSRPTLSTYVAGAFIVVGGLILTFWKVP
jgi:small multidrug resistance family-3 protein